MLDIKNEEMLDRKMTGLKEEGPKSNCFDSEQLIFSAKDILDNNQSKKVSLEQIPLQPIQTPSQEKKDIMS